jgi:predicted lysophospholipase L1 biosynthesis ABC-type transport system permease subunit
MRFGLDAEEIGLIAIISAIFVLRAFVPGITRRVFRQNEAKRSWSEWNWTEKAAVGLSVVLLVWVWVHRAGTLASVAAAIGIVMITISIRGLLALRARTRASRASRPTKR